MFALSIIKVHLFSSPLTPTRPNDPRTRYPSCQPTLARHLTKQSQTKLTKNTQIGSYTTSVCVSACLTSLKSGKERFDTGMDVSGIKVLAIVSSIIAFFL